MTCFILLLILAYLLGSINSAILVCKCFGLPSPRTVGSGNPGTTNVLRLGSKPAAAVTLIGDILKGIVPVLIARIWLTHIDELAFIGLAAIIGHLFPVWFGFKGGKGVATSIGVFFALNWILGLCFIGTWLIIALISRYSSLSAIIATLLTPVYGFFLLGAQALLPLIIIALLVLIRHRGNIVRLFSGTESKIGQKK